SPLYTYSSGMKLRLGFAVAIHSNPDIFLLDEGFSVGDENFRKKANEKILDLKNQKKTFVMVGHWMEELRRNCNRILWLEKGKIVVCGNKKILEKYERSFK
ncbi:ABC transporter ATP-binding protein, partial [archaeon]|nr:ABC transporter ATP-binding protein [archaeon]